MWSKKRLSLTESTRIQPKPSNPDAFRTTHVRSPPKTARLRRILDHSRPDSQWSPQEPGRRKRSGRACARIGVGYGALGQATWRAFPHWGRQEGIGVGKLPTPMGGFLSQCVSLESGGGAVPVLAAIPRGLRAPGSGSRAPWAVFTAIPTRRIPTFAAMPPLSQRYHTLQAL